MLGSQGSPLVVQLCLESRGEIGVDTGSKAILAILVVAVCVTTGFVVAYDAFGVTYLVYIVAMAYIAEMLFSKGRGK